MKEYAIIYCIQVLLDSVYRDMYKIYIGNKIRNLTRFYDDSYYIASHKTSTIFWGYVKNTRSVYSSAHTPIQQIIITPSLPRDSLQTFTSSPKFLQENSKERTKQSPT